MPRRPVAVEQPFATEAELERYIEQCSTEVARKQLALATAKRLLAGMQARQLAAN